MQWWRQVGIRRLVVPAWSALLAIAVLIPMFGRGYVLTYDMVWVPHLDLDRPEVWGLGTGLPRAVPSDAMVGLLGAVAPAALVQRVVLLVALVALGVGAARLLRDRPLVAQLAGATLAIWNPYVAERLVLGQWPMLVACAGLLWLVDAFAGRDAPRGSVAALALAATALTPASGVMGVLVGVIAAWRVGAVRVVVLGALLNAPWIVSGLLHASIGRTDPRAVGLFELQPEGHLGRLGSALTLGGIWNTEVVPTSRTLWTAVVLSTVIGMVIIVGVVTLWKDERRLVAVLVAAGILGLTVALVGWLAPDLVARVVAGVPAGGLVRDGTRWLALLVPLEAVAFGAGVHALLRRAELTALAVPVMVMALMLPLAALPDMAWGVGGRLEPASYPVAWNDARRVIDKTSVRGDVLVLPFDAYRRPSWNHDHPVLDPAGRYFGRTTVTNDELVVSGRTIAGEDPRAARIGRILEGRDVQRRLARHGMGLVLVDTEAPGATRALRAVKGARELDIVGDSLRLFAVPGARERDVADDDRTVIVVAWAAMGLTILLALVSAVRALPESRRRRHGVLAADNPTCC